VDVTDNVDGAGEGEQVALLCEGFDEFGADVAEGGLRDGVSAEELFDHLLIVHAPLTNRI
jgi:hypothetical protein